MFTIACRWLGRDVRRSDQGGVVVARGGDEGVVGGGGDQVGLQHVEDWECRVDHESDIDWRGVGLGREDGRSGEGVLLRDDGPGCDGPFRGVEGDEERKVGAKGKVRRCLREGEGGHGERCEGGV